MQRPIIVKDGFVACSKTKSQDGQRRPCHIRRRTTRRFIHRSHSVSHLCVGCDDRVQWTVPETQGDASRECIKTKVLLLSPLFLLFPILATSYTTDYYYNNNNHLETATMKFAALSVLFALVASVIALPADDASNLVRRDSCSDCIHQCDKSTRCDPDVECYEQLR